MFWFVSILPVSVSQVLSHNLHTVLNLPHDPVALEEHFRDDDDGPVSKQGYMPYLNTYILDKVRGDGLGISPGSGSQPSALSPGSGSRPWVWVSALSPGSQGPSPGSQSWVSALGLSPQPWVSALGLSPQH